ncbi:LysM peptidoglycan-binding domain-containing protein [Chromohalobacter sp. TMW 2.2308]|uniref:LysM peptidoglycan-binding domain-containing protein n=1 Tax=Chromohalobacter TaxID=42054 RepID=UPI001FFDA147|nr:MULTISPECIES: LysM peptidoglycan-binding domain-containing protein [Chromohalobacter]MCK2042299.1 LysM peptidoglycan-binding domain-containing protein [Chromohalobacter moromii]MCT8514446.1 LysM peptidoglycan-binding domain-containing protein [Chromohalobacter sp. TMW 2.2271]
MAERAMGGKGSCARIVPFLLFVLILAGCAGGPGAGGYRGGNIAGNWVSIQRGDTLGQIAKQAGVPLLRLQRFNPGVDARRLAIGQRILVPTHRERAPGSGPYRYQVRPGDTYSSIAQRFGSTAQRLQTANPEFSANALNVGQLLKVPLGGSARTTTASANQASSTASKSAARSRTLPDPGALPDSAQTWHWPLKQYEIARAYGTDARGTLQPMLLSTSANTQALAVADGTVRFADSMRQLGRVVIIHHRDNMQSVYALCQRLLVEDGDKVKQGTPVCDVGYRHDTGRHDLLFDVRHGGKPVDPKQVLR